MDERLRVADPGRLASPALQTWPGNGTSTGRPLVATAWALVGIGYGVAPDLLEIAWFTGRVLVDGRGEWVQRRLRRNGERP